MTQEPFASEDQMKAAVGEKAVHSTPAVALAARLPALCRAASRPNALPLIVSGARVATAACSAVSTAPMPTPASTNPALRSGTLAPTPANTRYEARNATAPPRSTSRLPRRSPMCPAGRLASVAATLYAT